MRQLDSVRTQMHTAVELMTQKKAAALEKAKSLGRVNAVQAAKLQLTHSHTLDARLTSLTQQMIVFDTWLETLQQAKLNADMVGALRAMAAHIEAVQAASSSSSADNAEDVMANLQEVSQRVQETTDELTQSAEAGGDPFAVQSPFEGDQALADELQALLASEEAPQTQARALPLAAPPGQAGGLAPDIQKRLRMSVQASSTRKAEKL
jgi:hypothetical protein